MPWSIIKVEDKYKLKNKITKKFVNKSFLSRQSAMKARDNYERYDKNKNKSKYK